MGSPSGLTWDDVVVFTFHVLPHLCGFFFNSEPLRGVAQGTYIGVGSAHYFCKQEADPYFGMNGVAEHMCRVGRPVVGTTGTACVIQYIGLMKLFHGSPHGPDKYLDVLPSCARGAVYLGQTF